jgi:hypothetical protein
VRRTATNTKGSGLLVPGWWGLCAAWALALSTHACDGDPAVPSVTKDAAAGDDAADARASTATPGLFCSPGVDPADPRITEFSAASFNGNKGRWTGDPNLTFFTYSYHDPDAPDSSNSDKVEGGVFTISGQVVVPGSDPSYSGGGMHFDYCVNTTAYTGVQFTLTGTSGGCTIYFDLQTYSQQAIHERGGCASYCYQFPRKVVTPQSTPITVRFSDLEGSGIPSGAAAMASEIMGMRWQAELAPRQDDAGQTACTFSLSVDDVKLVN